MTRLSYASSFLASSKLLAKLSCSVPCLHSFTATLVWRKFCSRPWIWIRKINQSLSNTSKTCWFTRPVACKWKPCCCYRCKARIKKNVKTDSNQKWNASGKLERIIILHNQILKISRRYQGIMEKWTNKLRGNTWCKKISRYSGVQKTEATGNYAFPDLKIVTQSKNWLFCYFFSPSHPCIRMHILQTILNTFPEVPTRRICLTIKSFYSRWSIPLFSGP